MSIEYDRNEHDLVECDVVKSLRRDTGLGNLVVYRHRLEGTWVLAIRSFDGKELEELGMVDGGDGTTQWPTRQHYQKMVRRLNMMVKGEFGDAPQAGIRQARLHKYDVFREAMQREQEAVKGLGRYFRKKHGNKFADDYLHECLPAGGRDVTRTWFPVTGR